MRLRERKEPTTVRRDVKIVNELGLHARPAAQFVRNANSFRSEIWLIKDGQRFSATSLIDVLRANLDCGATVTIEAHGVDAEAAIEKLAKVVSEFSDDEK